MRNAGSWAAVILLIFSALILWQSLGMENQNALGFGPGFFPFWLSILMIVLSIAYLFQSRKEWISIKEILPKKKALREFMLILVAMAVFVLTAEWIGFIAAGTISVFLLVYRAFSKGVAVGFSIGISLLLFFIFVKALSVPLPVNSFGW
ncbi:tripartite tricarboxylate transporter TctB family protein [Brevibacillus nitrificans]|uniref:tripartite tricarboxylate transporter TctB family protein n=1 Tax=Brevibacillus nitrificans TaxID=651560 RepID=UPI0028648CAA|nr:tripartite tricarboxylate transporter TctB family protein [Brevibacillus nitrificans]MDR7313895.1 magnesium-transporting ATPase (P-type) [Brevibacillus nitrificans]